MAEQDQTADWPISIEASGLQGIVWRATLELRFAISPGGGSEAPVLQQLFLSDMGKQEWRAVPIVVVLERRGTSNGA